MRSLNIRVARRAAVLPLLITSLMLFAMPGQAAKHERNWQTGTLLDAQKSRVYLGTYGQSNTSGSVDGTGAFHSSSSGSQKAKYETQETAVVDGGDKIYVVERFLKWPWNKEANLTTNAPIKYAIEGRKMYLLDDDGREYKTKIIKKTLKTQ
jgi:hypothetical protein